MTNIPVPPSIAVCSRCGSRLYIIDLYVNPKFLFVYPSDLRLNCSCNADGIWVSYTDRRLVAAWLNYVLRLEPPSPHELQAESLASSPPAPPPPPPDPAS